MKLTLGLLLLLAGLTLGCEERQPPFPREETFFPKGEEARLSGDYDTAIDAYLKSIETEPLDPRPYYGFVDSHARKGELETAEVTLRSMLEEGQDLLNARIHYGLGSVAVRSQNLEKALEEAQLAVSLDPSLGHGHLLHGSIHYHSGRPEDALEAWSSAHRVFKKQRDLKYQAWVLNMTALVHREMSDFRQALQEFDRALGLHRELGDAQAQQIVLGNIGLTRSDLGDLAGAMSAFGTALRLSREVGDRDSEGWNLTNLSHLHNLAGRYQRAMDYADSAIVLAHEMGNREDEISGLLTRATASLDLGDPIRALESCKEGLMMADSLADQRHRASVLLTMARTHLNLGRLERARDCYTRSDSLFRRIGAESGSWESLIGLCEVAVKGGDTTRAIALAEGTLERCTETGYADGEVFLSLFLSDLLRRRGDFPEAYTLAARALDLSRRDGRRNTEALALAKRAQIHLSQGNVSAAVGDADGAGSVAREVGSPEIIWECEMARGDARQDSDPGAALEHYEAAMHAIEAIRRDLRIEEFKASYLAGRVELYYKAAELLVKLGRDGEALAVCERSRARALRDLLASSPSAIMPRVEGPLAAKIRTLEEELQVLQASLDRMATNPTSDPQRVGVLKLEIARAKKEWEDVRAEVLLKDPRYGVLTSEIRGPDTEEILRAIPDGAALMEYALGPHSSLCFVARDGEVRSALLEVGGATIARDVEALRRPLQAPRSLTTLSYDLGLAERLRVQIFDPVAPFLEKATRLIIIPDGPLNYLPFEALVMSARSAASTDTLYGSFRDVEFLADRFVIEYLPSASLVVSPRGPLARDEERYTLLAMGSPNVAGHGLPSSEQEVQAVGGLFHTAILGLGEEASERRFKELAPRYRLLHISSHGEVDEQVPLYSYLQLSPDASEDGILHAHEVLALRLDCDLVSLSACETGLGRLYAGEGLLGLTRAFFHAGARQALVSLWSVNDASSAILMESFYSNLLGGLDAAGALRNAKLSLRQVATTDRHGQSVSLAHPFFWAPFVLLGTEPSH